MKKITKITAPYCKKDGMEVFEVVTYEDDEFVNSKFIIKFVPKK